jgi:hypothetical protein
MAKTAAKTTTVATANLRKVAAKADAMYQFAVCSGLALMAGFVGTAGAFVLHAA